MSNETEPVTESPLLNPRPSSGGLDRSDVVVRKGRLHAAQRPPHAAAVDDRGPAVPRRRAHAADVDHLLIRGNDQRPVIALDERDRQRAESAVMAAAVGRALLREAPGQAGRPRAATTASAPSTSASSACSARGSSPSAVCATAPRRASSSSSGASPTPRSSLPVENALMRRSLPIDEFVLVDIERYGRTWRTVEHMFDDHVSDIRFPIDIVFSWVDGNAIEYQRARQAAQSNGRAGRGRRRPRPVPADRRAEVRPPLGATCSRRGSGQIYIATDSPGARTGSPSTRGSASSAARSSSPTRPCCRPTTRRPSSRSCTTSRASASTSSTRTTTCSSGAPSTRRCSSARARSRSSSSPTTRIGLGSNNPARSGFENSARVNRRLLQQRFGAVTTRHLEHAPTPLRAQRS